MGKLRAPAQIREEAFHPPLLSSFGVMSRVAGLFRGVGVGGGYKTEVLYVKGVHGHVNRSHSSRRGVRVGGLEETFIWRKFRKHFANLLGE